MSVVVTLVIVVYFILTFGGLFRQSYIKRVLEEDDYNG